MTQTPSATLLILMAFVLTVVAVGLGVAFLEGGTAGKRAAKFVLVIGAPFAALQIVRIAAWPWVIATYFIALGAWWVVRRRSVRSRRADKPGGPHPRRPVRRDRDRRSA